MSERKKFKFKPTSDKTIKERSTNTGSYDQFTKSKYPRYKVKDGENSLRVLPRTWDDTEKYGDNWGLPIKLHYNVGPDKGAYLCNRMLGERCDLCDERSQLQKDGDEEAASELRPGDRVLCWVIDRDAEKEGPQVYAMPATKIEVELQLLSRDDDTGELLQISDPDEGFDISFTKTGSGKKTDYKGVRIARKSSPLHDNEKRMNEWLDYITDNPLPETLNFYDNKYLSNIYGGASSKRDDDDDDNDSKSERRRGRDDDDDKGKEDKRSRRSRDDDDDDDDKSSKRRSSKDDDDDDDDKGSKSSRRDKDEESSRSSRSRSASKDDDDDDDRSSKKRARDDDDDDDKKGRSKDARESVDRLRKKQEDDDDDDDKSSKRSSKRSSDDDDDKDSKSERKRRSRDDDDDDDDKGKDRKRRSRDDDDD